MSGNIFMDCSAQHDESDGDDMTNIIMQCVSDTYQNSQDSRDDNLRSFLLVICGGMIFFMQSGFAMMCAGSVRLKNVQNTMLKNLLDACGAALAFYLIGTFAPNERITNQDIQNRSMALAYHKLLLTLFFPPFRHHSFPSKTRLRLCFWWRRVQSGGGFSKILYWYDRICERWAQCGFLVLPIHV